MSADFLVELGTEELPPKSLGTLIDAFRDGLAQGLADSGLEHGAIKSYATPRRLALQVSALAERTPVREQQVWGPPAQIAFDADGKPTKAAIAFAEKNSVAVEALSTANDGKADKLVALQRTGGQPVTELLGPLVEQALAQLPIAKRMRWGARRTEFVRPVHWLLLLLDDEIVDAEVLGLRANRVTRGHRFHCNRELVIDRVEQYEHTLSDTGRVLADRDARRALIEQQVKAEAEKAGGTAVIDPDLLDEVTALVEWPVALLGNFEKRFLDVPQEALIASMKEHQKYFHVVDPAGKLLPHFITVANLESRDPAQVIDGNERVIRPRLADAAFFYDTDRKTSLDALRERLKTIVFQAKLGTVYDKTERVAALAKALAGKIGADAALAERAGQLSKSDLASNMVGEFDKMQGIAGYYYALNDGEAPEVAQALNEQYLPRFAGDQLPQTTTGTLLALADRLDTLTGIFGIGQQPTGSKDPFALRRASQGALRLLVEKQLDLDLRPLLIQAAQQHPGIDANKALVDKVLGYMLERLRAWYEDAGIAVEVFQAVSARQVTAPLDFDQRVKAVHEFTRLPQAQPLAAANKRVSNILAKSDAGASGALDAKKLSEEAEIQLAAAVAAKAEEVAPLLQQRQYTRALAVMADLQPAVDAFFDQVMVMTDDPTLRNNRLALLQQLRDLFLQVADISLLAPGKG